MHQGYTEEQVKKGSASKMIGSALIGAAVGAAVMIATDEEKRKTTVEKAKDVKDRVQKAVSVIKKNEKQMVNETADALLPEDDGKIRL